MDSIQNKTRQHRITATVFRLLLAVLMLGSIPSLLPAGENPVVTENRNPGTTAWRLTKWANDADQQIKGFASATSINKGEEITFYVTVNPVQSYNIAVYRMGWYGGAGGRLMHESGPLTGIRQPAPIIDADTGLTYCPWEASYTLPVPSDWTSGVYLAKLTNTEGFENYIVFTVRDDDRVADFLYQQPVTTYQAYNAFPAETGKSLYVFNSNGPNTVTGTPRAVKVSFDRPYWGNGAGDFLSWELDLIMWLEKSGYDVNYATDIELHNRGFQLLEPYKALIVAGHDEYWSKSKYDAAENARDSGVDLAFFGSNAVYWAMRMEASVDGVPDRVVVSYKDGALDPVTDPEQKTLRWRELGRAEQALVGVQYIADGEFSSDGSTNADYVVINSDHWAYSNTGLSDGDRIPGLVGYEVDTLFSNSLFPEYPLPVSSNHTLLSASPYTAGDGQQVTSNSSIYQAPGGAWVFATGTMSWSWGLNREGLISPAIQITTANILDRFIEQAPADENEVCAVYMSSDVDHSGYYTGWGSHHGMYRKRSGWWRASSSDDDDDDDEHYHEHDDWSAGSRLDITSMLRIDDWGTITDVNVVDLSGSGMAAFKKIRVTLASPDETRIKLAGKCDRISGFDLNLDDQADHYLGRKKSEDCLPDDGNSYVPKKGLDRFIGQQSAGTWTLKITGKRKQHYRYGPSGNLDSWGLEICRTVD